MKDDKEYYFSNDGTIRSWVESDDEPMDPREWDNFGTMVCFHNKYKLGDSTDFKKDDYDSWSEVRDAIEANGGVLILPLGLYDHSGISMYVGDSHDRWDGGQVGFIYCSMKDIQREGFTLESAERLLRQEVEYYNQYLLGSVYKYVVEEKIAKCSCGECEEWLVIDSCGGYFNYKEAIASARAMVGMKEVLA